MRNDLIQCKNMVVALLCLCCINLYAQSKLKLAYHKIYSPRNLKAQLLKLNHKQLTLFDL